MATTNQGSPSFARVTAGTPVAPENVVAHSLPHVVRVEVPAMLRPAEHLPGTFKLRLSGPGALTARPEQIGAALLEAGKIRSAQEWHQCQYYRLQNPFERYVSFGGELRATALKHGDVLEAKLDTSSPSKAKIEVFDLDNRESRFTLQFVPPGATQNYVEALLMGAGLTPQTR